MEPRSELARPLDAPFPEALGPSAILPSTRTNSLMPAAIMSTGLLRPDEGSSSLLLPVFPFPVFFSAVFEELVPVHASPPIGRV